MKPSLYRQSHIFFSAPSAKSQCDFKLNIVSTHTSIHSLEIRTPTACRYIGLLWVCKESEEEGPYKVSPKIESTFMIQY